MATLPKAYPSVTPFLWSFFQPTSCRRFTGQILTKGNKGSQPWSCARTQIAPLIPAHLEQSHFRRQPPRQPRYSFSTISIVSDSIHSNEPPLANSPPVVIPERDGDVGLNSESTNTGRRASATAESPTPTRAPLQSTKIRSRLRPSKAAISLTPAAVSRLRALLSGPTPQLIRIGVRNKGCAGMSYHLDYVESPGKFDEVVEQEGVRVLIDSKALFSIIGSEMDWKEDKLSSKFAFKNPNIKDACGCGESFNI